MQKILRYALIIILSSVFGMMFFFKSPSNSLIENYFNFLIFAVLTGYFPVIIILEVIQYLFEKKYKAKIEFSFIQIFLLCIISGLSIISIPLNNLLICCFVFILLKLNVKNKCNVLDYLKNIGVILCFLIIFLSCVQIGIGRYFFVCNPLNPEINRADGIVFFIVNFPKVVLNLNYDSEKMIFYSIDYDNLWIVKKIISDNVAYKPDSKEYKTLIYAALNSGRFKIAQYLMDRSNNKELKKEFSSYFLLQLCKGGDYFYGRKKYIEEMLQIGAQLDYKNRIGKTALDYAREKGDKEIISLLEDAMKKKEEK